MAETVPAMSVTLEQHPIGRLLPRMTTQEFQGLVKSVRGQGVLQPIVIFEGAVLDGWHRLLAARHEDLDVELVDLAELADPFAHVAALNLRRRHLTQKVCVKVALELRRAQEERGGVRRGAGSRQDTESERWQCGGCGTLNDPGTLQCRHCENIPTWAAKERDRLESERLAAAQQDPILDPLGENFDESKNSDDPVSTSTVPVTDTQDSTSADLESTCDGSGDLTPTTHSSTQGEEKPAPVVTPSNRDIADAHGVDRRLVDRVEREEPPRETPMQRLRAENARLRTENAELRAELDKAQSIIALYRQQELPAETQGRVAELTNKLAVIDGLRAEMRQQQYRYDDTIGKLRKKIRSLENGA